MLGRGLLGVTRCVAGAVIVWSASAFAQPAAAPAHDPAAAREQLKLGYTLAQSGKCDEALPHLTESLRLDARAITLINLADCEEKTGKLVAAYGHWNDAKLRADAEEQKPIGEEATRRMTALDPKIPRLTLSLAAGSPPDASVERDSTVVDPATFGKPVMLDPGSYNLVLHAKGHDDAKTTLTLSEGEQRALRLAVGPATAAVAPAPPAQPITPPPPAAEHRSMSLLVPIGFGIGGAGVVFGAITGILAIGKASDVKDGCPQNHCRSQTLVDEASSGKTLGTLSTVGFIVGGVGAAVGVVGLFSGGTSDAKVDVGIGPSNVLLRGRF